MNPADLSEALFDAREATKSRIVELAEEAEDIVAPFRDRAGMEWVRKMFDKRFRPRSEDPAEIRRAAILLYASSPFSVPIQWGPELERAALKWLRGIESEVYRAETMAVADAMHEHTPEWLIVKAEIDEGEERAAQSPIIAGIQQETWLHRAVRDLIEAIQSKAAAGVLRMMGGFADSIQAVVEDIDASFDTFSRSLSKLAIEGGTWAANVARKEAARSWASQ